MKVFAVYETDDQRSEYSIEYMRALFLHQSDAEKYVQDLKDGYRTLEEIRWMPDFSVCEKEVQESYTTPLAEYTIYFPNKEDGNYSKVGTVMASSLEDAWTKAQNTDAPWNPAEPCRSAMVGDHIETPDHQFYKITGTGFTDLGYPAEEDLFTDPAEEEKWDNWIEFHDQPDQE